MTQIKTRISGEMAESESGDSFFRLYWKTTIIEKNSYSNNIIVYNTWGKHVETM